MGTSKARSSRLVATMLMAHTYASNCPLLSLTVIPGCDARPSVGYNTLTARSGDRQPHGQHHGESSHSDYAGDRRQVRRRQRPSTNYQGGTTRQTGVYLPVFGDWDQRA